MESEDIRLKVVFTGESNVGKTTLIYWQAEKKFPPLGMTIGMDFKNKDYQIGQMTAHAMLWDTVGGERSKTIRNPLYRNSHAICLCFSLNEKYTFERVSVWIKNFQLNQLKCPLFLVGCKADLEHVISDEEIKEYAAKEGMTYFETSSIADIGVKENIQKVMEAAYDFYQKNPHVRMKPISKPVQNPGFCWS